MSIRAKIVLVVLPLIIAPLVLTGVWAVLAARESVTSVATGLLQFKAEQLVTYAQGQWDLLVANGLDDDAAYRAASEAAVETFARSLLRTPTELVVGLGTGGALALRTADIAEDDPGLADLRERAAAGRLGWQSLQLSGIDRVAHAVSFEPFRWTLFVTEASAVFYRSTERIVTQTAVILGASLAAAALLLLVFSGYLTRPLRQIADAMTAIITTGDLSRRVETLYRDETGRLGHAFNLMTADLEKAYGHVKGYALRAAIARADEEKIRTIFQKFVPKKVIDDFYASPEKMLTGRQAPVAVLFSDIRDFTKIAEGMSSRQLVDILNDYFKPMAQAIYEQHGVVDKYIGDAIMAVFGAPETQENDALAAVLAALGMIDALRAFNEAHRDQLPREFRIGIGLHYGLVTVGNIGSDQKMDYTVIGDRVNLASRIESLSKVYLEPLLVSDSVQRRVRDQFPSRLLDRVVVAGRSEVTGIYTLRRALGSTEAQAWLAHEKAIELYYARSFAEAASGFRRVLELVPDDRHAARLLHQCERLRASPPPKDWTGVVVLGEK